MKQVFETLEKLMKEHVSCMLVSAVGGRGSVPRKVQAHMLVTHEGRMCGTVGGGAIEGRAIVLAKHLLKYGQSGMETFVLRENDAQNLGMICGGEATLHFKYISSSDEDTSALVRQAVSLFRAGQSAWLIIRFSDHAVSLWDESRLTGTDIPKAVLDALPSSAACVKVHDETYYVERLVSAGRVYIFGGGHVAQALVPILASVDFRCVILEDREEFADPALFGGVHEVRLITPDRWEKGLSLTRDDCICIMTRGHQNDLECQAFALKTPAYYIGVIGSRKKIAIAREKLLQMGFLDDEIARLHTPIGLPIGAQTPAEIAVSIAAEMIQCRAQYRNA